MLSFLKLFIRNAIRDKAFTTLNILGLSIGMSAFIIIMLWVSDELSYDSYNANADRIYKMKMYYRFNGVERTSSISPAPLAEALKNDFPEVENVVRFRDHGYSIIKYGENVYNERQLIFADSTFFDIFSIPVVKGNAKTALVFPNTVAISESMAKKYFGQEDPVDKMLRINNRRDFRVTAVYKDIPQASHFHFGFIASLYSFNEYNEGIWLNANFPTYLLLNKNADLAAFRNKLSQLVDKYVAPQAATGLGTTWEDLQEKGLRFEFSFLNLREIHLTPGIFGEFEPSGNIKLIYIFSLIAVFIILLACINFTNLSTARSASRLKEVGIRKVFGIQRGKLSLQFMIESFLIVFVAHIVAMILTEISLPIFNDLAGKNLTINYFDVAFIGLEFGIIIVISFIAGSYPAIYLSSFKPITILRKEMVSGRKRTLFRSILVVGQFAISLALLSSTLILYRQLNYLHNTSLGYNKENLLVIDNTYLLKNNIDNFKNQILTNPNVLNVTISQYLPSPSTRDNGSIFRDGIISNDPLFCTHFNVDYDYIKTFDMKIVKGRPFSRDFPSDSSGVIINEAEAKLLGYEDPIGKKIGTATGREVDVNKPALDVFTIIGVVKDFNHSSLHEPVGGLAMYLKSSTSSITCRINPEANISQILAFIKEKWSENAPDQPFEYDFVSESLDRQYGGEIRLGRILGIFTGLAFFVCCLGLIGLALFAAEQRKKEIGLRKVNGSGITHIIWLLTSDFTKLILIAFIIATPVSWYMMNKWLESFAYRINISIWVFIATGLISYLIAMCAVGYFSFRAAATNPVETLKNE